MLTVVSISSVGLISIFLINYFLPIISVQSFLPPEFIPAVPVSVNAIIIFLDGYSFKKNGSGTYMQTKVASLRWWKLKRVPNSLRGFFYFFNFVCYMDVSSWDEILDQLSTRKEL